MGVLVAELRDLYSPDVPDLRNPNLPENAAFCVPLEADFGAVGEEGQDQFNFLVCNPRWIAEKAEKGVLTGMHLLVVERFDLAKITEFLSTIAEQTIGSDWTEIAGKLGRYGRWEFADMHESGYWVN